ncbi:Alpha/Beta hydrolase protein [Exophiala viscosa]|uniref:Alpha/Beta hydrolase protein n=1 Tax=Exophiala viscosa TaxID=2486360 RepID=A0AAN6DU24_9EURO|nr:Alpha/Beta hydrolase protein [Exophiala viscosa]KAI1623783.1 Alpha/Beta hydrolase protein [Exophiala viscosa]
MAELVPPTPGQVISTPVEEISFLEKLAIVPALLTTLCTVAFAAVTAPFRGEAGTRTFKEHILYTALRTAVKNLSTGQMQFISEPFSKIYEKWCKDNGSQPEFVTLKSGCKAFWMGDHQTAKYIVVYYHGGGFSLDGEDTHLKFYHGVQTTLKESDIPVAFLFVEYTLVPHATYPTQVREAVESVSYVMTELKRPASDIILGGDSAGGNMCLAVLSHLMHPSSDFPELKLADGDKLKALLLVAPWVHFGMHWESSRRNLQKDFVSPYGGEMWARTYLGGRESDFYTEAAEAPADWWKDAKVEHVLCTVGSDELLFDCIDAWVKKYKSVNPDGITYVIGAHEAHIAPIMNVRFGLTTETEQGAAIKSWMKARL